MPRHKTIKRKIVQPDPIYKSRLVSRFVNSVMKDGKKITAEKITYEALSKLSEDKKEALKIFEDALKNVMPRTEVRSRRVGGATYQIPSPLKHDRSEALAIRWLIGVCKQKKGRTMAEKLAEELKLAQKNEGASIKKRDDTHKMAAANRAFAHFRW